MARGFASSASDSNTLPRAVVLSGRALQGGSSAQSADEVSVTLKAALLPRAREA